MTIAPLALNEPLRLAALNRLHILDTPVELAFDRIAKLAARLYEAPIATITLLDKDRQWFKACVGMTNRQTPRDPAFCAHTILQDEVLIVHDALKDHRFWDNPFVTGPPYIRFYAGAPLTTGDGHKIGTVCVIDPSPRTAGQIDRHPLKDLAALTMNLLESRLAPNSCETPNECVTVLSRATEHSPLSFRRLLFSWITRGAGHF